MLLHFILGLAGSYLGGIPFGPINLSVVDTTLRHGRKAASKFSLASSLVEIGEAAVAILFGHLFSIELESTHALKILVIFFFIAAGLYFILKKDDPELVEQKKGSGHFFRGLSISFLNPQAIPFWIFVLTYLDTYDFFHLEDFNIITFLIGVALGKYLILTTFGVFSSILEKRLKNICKMISNAIGITLLVIGAVQAVRYFVI